MEKWKNGKMAINIIVGYPLIRFAVVGKTKCDAKPSVMRRFFSPTKVSIYLPKQTNPSLRAMRMTSSARPIPFQPHYPYFPVTPISPARPILLSRMANPARRRGQSCSPARPILLSSKANTSPWPCQLCTRTWS